MIYTGSVQIKILSLVSFQQSVLWPILDTISFMVRSSSLFVMIFIKDFLEGSLLTHPPLF